MPAKTADTAVAKPTFIEGEAALELASAAAPVACAEPAAPEDNVTATPTFIERIQFRPS